MKTIYKKLLASYGKQGWWPVTNTSKEKKQLEIIIGAILTQNTSWKNVEKAIIKLNKNKLIDIDKILKINNKKLAEIIKSSGYYNQKAERLRIICKFLKENPIKQLERLSSKELREKLLNIKGIGKETADSIILYAFNKKSFVVDAYTKRIFNRTGKIKTKDYDEIKNIFEKQIKKINEQKEYHALIVEHAKNYCKKKPLCKECFLKDCKRIISPSNQP
jgi:endonuclease-3 related protein